MAAGASAAARARPAPPAPAPFPPREPGRAARQAPRARVAGGVLWIFAVAGLLAGIVALNVAVLRLNVEGERLDVRKEKLVAANAALATDRSGLASTARIEAVARQRLGLVPPLETTYLTTARRAR